MRRYKRYFFGGEASTSRSADLGRAALRVFAGLALAFAHGLGKFPPSEELIEAVSDLGFPLAVFFAWAAALSEFVGGLFLACGFLTRPASFFILVTMSVAVFLNHAGDPFETREKAFIYAVIALMYLLTGAGRYSVDALIRRKRV